MPTLLEIQTRLRELGFDPGPLDGGAGPLTARAVKAFQVAHGLAADGRIGPDHPRRAVPERSR